MSKRQFSNEQFSTLLIMSYLSECYCSRPVVWGFFKPVGTENCFLGSFLAAVCFFRIWSTGAAPSTSASSRFWFWLSYRFWLCSCWWQILLFWMKPPMVLHHYLLGKILHSVQVLALVMHQDSLYNQDMF